MFEPLRDELVAQVRRSPMFPELSWQEAILKWLRSESLEGRAQFAVMLAGVEDRYIHDAQDEALVDRLLRQEART